MKWGVEYPPIVEGWGGCGAGKSTRGRTESSTQINRKLPNIMFSSTPTINQLKHAIRQMLHHHNNNEK